jgi:phosphatidylinositol alpha-1,6-mannosyltransferase
VSSQDYLHHPIPSRHHYIFEELAKRGHAVHVVHFHTHDAIHPLRQTKLISHDATAIPVHNPLIHYVVNAPYHLYMIDKIIREENIEVVVAAHVLAGSAAIIAARKNGIPVIFDLKDWFPDSAAAYIKNRVVKEVVRKTVYYITKWNLSNSDWTTTVSPALAKKAVPLGHTPEVIMNGVDTTLFKPGLCKRAHHRLCKGDFVIGFSGSVERWYALDKVISVLPDLIKHNENVVLLIVGGALFTGYQMELRKLVHVLGLEERVIWTGSQPYEKLPEYINCMDICIIPLDPPQWRDIALPNKFFEYSACGKPIVATYMKDVMKLNPSNMYVYGNMTQFVQQIKHLIDSTQTFNLDFEQHSWSNRATQFERRLKECVNK